MSNQNQMKSKSETVPDPGLGRLLDHFPRANRTVYRWIWLFLGFLLIIIGSYLSIQHLLKTLSAINTYGRAVLLKPDSWMILALILFLPPGIFLISWSFSHRNDAVYLYEKGFLIQKGKQEQSWLWKNVTRIDTPITNVKFGGDTITTHSKIILNEGDQKIKIISSRYDRMTELVQKVREIVLPMLIETAQNRLNGQKMIDFGNEIRVDQLGLEVQGNHYAWMDLSEPLIEHTTLRINLAKTQTPILRSNINEIKNLDVLLHLIKNPPTTPS